MSKAGPIIPVHVLSASDLRANGGSYALRAGAALRVEGFTSATTNGRAIAGESALPVYIISDSDLRANGGSYALDGDPQTLPIINTTTGDYKVQGGPAIPIYVVSPSGWPNPTPATSLFDDLLFYLSLEEASGNRLDASGNGKTFAPTNNPNNAAGIVGNALNLASASSQYISRSDAGLATAIVNGFSLSCWVYPNDMVGSKMVLSKGVDGEVNILLFDGTNELNVELLNFDFMQGLVVVTPAIPVSVWTHIVITVDAVAGVLNVYRDGGVPDTNTNGDFVALANSSSTFGIGAYADGPDSFFNGRIDEFAMWNRVLTSEEITFIYNGGACNPIANWT